ncbi:MAG: hypothetical protein J6N20_05720 [Pseudomonas sp.]|nr:hypothetical protein [Pseudomonas sp.]
MSGDFLSMSDADFMSAGQTKLHEVQAAAETNVDTTTEVPAASEVTEPVVEPGAAEETHEETETPGESGKTAEEQAAIDTAKADDKDEPELGIDGLPVEPKPQEAALPAESAAQLPEGVERIFSTIRANGRDMQVKTVDEAIRLIQMGANYSQKRAADKKNLGYVRVLEQNGLLDHEKLSFAVDLLAGKPEAIGKLLKDSKIDVHDLDEDKVAAYRSESRAPSEATMAIEEVVADLNGNEHFERLVGDMKGWDQASQALLGQHPASLAQLTEQVGNGVYDKVMDEVNRQQVLGNLNGVPLMQAYNQIGQEMAAAGAFNAPAPKGPVKKLVTPGSKASPAKTADEERRRAAAPSKGVTTATEEVKDPKFLAMSDDDFLKSLKR